MFVAPCPLRRRVPQREGNRESGECSETDGEEYQAPRGARERFSSQPTVSSPSFAISPFRVFAILFPKASRDVQVKGIPAAEVGILESLPMFGVHADCDDVIRGAEEDRESAKGRRRNRRRRVSGSAWPHATRFAASQASLSFFRVFALSRFRDPLSKASRDVQVKGIPAAEVGILESLPMFGVHADCDDVIRGAERIAKSERAKARNRRRRVSGSAWPHAIRFAASQPSLSFFRIFALSRFRDPLSESIPRYSR